MENTTIQVQKSTVQVLEKAKRMYSVSSYDKAILKLAEHTIKIPKSLFGSHPEMKKFVREEDDFHDL